MCNITDKILNGKKNNEDNSEITVIVIINKREIREM